MSNDGLGDLEKAAPTIVHDESPRGQPSCLAAFSPARQRRRLRNEVSVAIVVKVMAIVALMLAFFAPSERPHISAQSMFQANAPFGPAAKEALKP